MQDSSPGSCGWWGSCWRLDLGRPSRLEARVVTMWSLYVAIFFWVIAFLNYLNGNHDQTIWENGIESFLDVVSTLVMLWRLSAPDALAHTERNAIVEARTSIFLGFTMVCIGGLFISDGASGIMRHDANAGQFHFRSSVVDMALTLPSIMLYLVIGMLQLQMAFVLRLRSLVQDAAISLLGTIVAAGALVACIIDLLAFVKQNAISPQRYVQLFDEHDNLVGYSILQDVSPDQSLRQQLPQLTFADENRTSFRSNPFGNRIASTSAGQLSFDHAMSFTYHNHVWYLEHVTTIVSASFVLLCGLGFLYTDTRNGVRWWKAEFWFARLPPRPTGEHTPMLKSAAEGAKNLRGPAAKPFGALLRAAEDGTSETGPK